MITVFSQKDAFAFDELTITSKHLTERELMDNAGRSIAQFIVEQLKIPLIRNLSCFLVRVIMAEMPLSAITT